jgi:hypothetical protein
MSGSPNKIKASPEEAALADIAKKNIDYYTKNYLPVTKNIIQDFQGSLPYQERQQLGMASGAVEQAFAREAPTIQNNMAAQGVDVSSGRGLRTLADFNANKGTSKANALADTRNAVNNTYLQNLANIARMGQGQQAGSLQTMGSIADRSQQQAILDARASAAARNAVSGLAGQAIGYGLGAASNYGGSTPPPNTSYMGAFDPNANTNFSLSAPTILGGP